MSKWISIKDKLPESNNYLGRVEVQINMHSEDFGGDEHWEEDYVTTAIFDDKEKIFIVDKDADFFFNPLIEHKPVKNAIFNKITHWAYLNKPIKKGNNK